MYSDRIGQSLEENREVRTQCRPLVPTPRFIESPPPKCGKDCRGLDPMRSSSMEGMKANVLNVLVYVTEVLVP